MRTENTMLMYNNKLSRITLLPAFSHTELRNINHLIQTALLSSHLQQRLLTMDVSLQMEFDLPAHVWDRLSKINASSMADFCGELLRLQGEMNS
jgi:hypothetical protein